LAASGGLKRGASAALSPAPPASTAKRPRSAGFEPPAWGSGVSLLDQEAEVDGADSGDEANLSERESDVGFIDNSTDHRDADPSTHRVFDAAEVRSEMTSAAELVAGLERRSREHARAGDAYERDEPDAEDPCQGQCKGCSLWGELNEACLAMLPDLHSKDQSPEARAAFVSRFIALLSQS